MALEAIPNYNDLFNFMVNDAMNATQCGCNDVTMENNGYVPEKLCDVGGRSGLSSLAVPPGQFPAQGTVRRRLNLGVQGRKKRKRRPQVCKNKEEAETQRMTHITVERNRRKQMNEHLSVLRSLMPESFAQRGDQASIVGGAIEFVKELEQLVHTLEVQKLFFVKRSAESMRLETHEYEYENPTSETGLNHKPPDQTGRFSDFFTDPQYHYSSQICNNKYTLRSKGADSDMEVTLIETHANIRILSKKNPSQLSKLVSGLQMLRLTMLHLNVTSLDPLVLYSISAKVEEGCQLTSVDSIAEAVHHMLRIIEEDALLPLSC